MSQSKINPQVNLSLQSTQQKNISLNNNSTQNNIQKVDQANQSQKKQEDNDYQCQFKLTVKQKFQEKLKVDATQQLFIIIVNQIIEQRIKKNYQAQPDQPPLPQMVQNIEQNQQEQQTKGTGPNLLERMKAEDEQIKKKIKQLMKKRPKKKGIKYQLDPNRDKGFILAKKMNQIKQQRQKKRLQQKKFIQQQKKELFESQIDTITMIQNFSIELARNTKRSLRYSNNQAKSVNISSNDNYKLPKLVQRNTFFTDYDEKNKQSNAYDFLNTSNAKFLNTQRRILTQRTHSSSKSSDRDLQRQIQILRKSQKRTQKYQIKKIMIDILDSIIFNSVKLVQTKKQFFFNAPPKPVHQMIRNYKDKNGKTIWLPGSKPQKFRINVHLSRKSQNKQIRYSSSNQNKNTISSSFGLQKMKISEYESEIHVSTSIDPQNQQQLRLSKINKRKINQTIDICLINKKHQQNNYESQQQYQKRQQEGKQNCSQLCSDENKSQNQGQFNSKAQQNQQQSNQLSNYNPQNNQSNIIQ